MGKFGSRSIAFRPKPHGTSQAYHSPAKYWKGPFRFFDLPPELRDHILGLLLFDVATAGKDIVSILLTCQRIYAEVASMFYYDFSLGKACLTGKGDPFLTGSLTRVAPRQYVRNLTMRFEIKEEIYLFGEAYGAALNQMAEEGKLQHLRLEIGSPFPSLEFWGYEDELFVYDNIRVAGGKGKGTIISGPILLTKTPFQNFLRFLDESKIPKITLWVDAGDHSKFWCQFHRVHQKGRTCDGEWKGRARCLKIHYPSLVKALRGAQVVEPARNDC